ncbi:hypothetical protein D3C79_905100 [compost metagenome]
MPRQFPAFANQPARSHPRCTRRIQFLDNVRQKQYLPCLDVDGLGDVGVGLRLALGARSGIEIAAEQWRQIPRL